MDKTAAVVVTYNRRNLLEENLKALISQEGCNLDIIVVDNASSDGTGDMVKAIAEDCNNIHYYNTGKNLGGAGGFNKGIKIAAENNTYKYVWVMDDDCIPRSDALKNLINAAKALGDDFGFLSSKALWKDGSICTMNIPRESMYKNLQNYSHDLQRVEMASFVSLFLKRETIIQEGLPIKDFFIWTDDWEYTRRISRNKPCYWVKNSVVMHKSVSNIGANIYSDSSERIDRYFYLYRNDVYLYRREGIKGLMYEAARLTWHLIKVLLSPCEQKGKRVKKIFEGTLAGLSFYPPIEYIIEAGEGK